MSKYKHKDICLSHFDCEYLNRNNESLETMRKIYDGEIPYISDFYPMLINNMERLYKGITKELQILYPDEIKLTDIMYQQGHHFNQFASIVNKYIPLSDSPEGYCTVLNGIQEIQNLYNNTRFITSTDIEDFRKVFRRYETQMSRMYLGIQRLQEKEKSEREDDISLW